MEQHPVPQNVTTFQFRLIGDMTIKQFGYLAGGAILAYISYKLPLPFFFTWPMTIIFAIGGFGFAFVPVEERPMDVWVLSFIRSVYSPTQYVWSHQAPSPTTNQPSVRRSNAMPFSPMSAFLKPRSTLPSQSAPPTTQQQKSDLGQTHQTADVVKRVFSPQAPSAQTFPSQNPAPPAQAQELSRVMTLSTPQNPFAWIMDLFSPHAKKTAASSAPVGNFPMPSITGKRMDLSSPPVVRPTQTAQDAINQTKQKETALEQKLVTLKKDLENKSMTEARVLELQKQLTEVLAQKEKMENELVTLRRQVATPPASVVSPAAPAQQPLSATIKSQTATPQPPKNTTEGPSVKIITQEGAVKAGLPRLTTFPNVVTGIIKDGDNNLLPGVLVTVKDKDGIPLRALKTNRLGQFAASTPLANGVYFVEIEDPRLRFTFNRVQITLNGSIVPAVEIIAKSQKQVNREKLAKEIFGQTP